MEQKPKAYLWFASFPQQTFTIFFTFLNVFQDSAFTLRNEVTQFTTPRTSDAM